MAVFKVEKYKNIKNQDGNIHTVLKSKDEYNKETRNGTAIWYFKTYKKDFDGINRPYKSKKYKTKSEAQEAERIFLMNRDNPLHKNFSLVAHAFLDYSYKNKKEATAVGYEDTYYNHIEPFFSHFNIDEINTSNINEWKVTMLKKTYIRNNKKKKYSIDYLNRIYTVLSNIFTYAIKNYGLLTNYVELAGCFQRNKNEIVENNKLRYITYDDFNKFISVIDEPMWKTFFIVLYYTGVRKGEIQALTWSDIDFDSRMINITKTLSTKCKETTYKITPTKNYKKRQIQMSNTLYESLLSYKKQQQKYSDFKESWYVFGSNRFMPETSINRHKKKYFELSGVTPITLHEFRHSHVSLLINNYIKSGQTDTTKFFLMVGNRMGHTVDVMQRTYMHLFPTIQDEIVDLLDNL